MCMIELEHLHLVCCMLYMLPRKLTRADVSKFPQKMEDAKCDFSKCEKARSVFKHFIWLLCQLQLSPSSQKCNNLQRRGTSPSAVPSAARFIHFHYFYYHRYIVTLASCPVNFLHPPSLTETVLLPLWCPLPMTVAAISTTMAMEEVLY